MQIKAIHKYMSHTSPSDHSDSKYQRQRLGRAIGVLILGLSLANCPSVKTPPTEETSGTFHALTYNVHGLPDLITGDDTLARQEQIGPLLNGFDLVAMQEDFQDEGHEILASASNHPTQERFEYAFPDRAYGPGLAIFTRFEVIEHFKEHFEVCHGFLDHSSDCLASKGFHMIRFRLADNAEIDVYNSHFEAGGSQEDYAARESHVDQVIAAMKEHSQGRAILFLGDTNLHGDDEVETVILERWLNTVELSDACEAVSCAEPGRIDRILFRSGDNLTIAISAKIQWTTRTQAVEK